MVLLKSDLPGFYRLSVEERIKKLQELAHLTPQEAEALKTGGIDLSSADRMIENVIGTIRLPVGVAPYFVIDGKEYVVPMALEEPSVIAAAAHAAKLAKMSGGFTCHVTEPVMIGQIQLLDAKDAKQVESTLKQHFSEIQALANKQDSILIQRGGGLRDIEVHDLKTKRKHMVVVHLLVNVQDAMGANCVNTMCEAVGPYIEKVTNSRVLLRIISNLADKRMVTAKAVWKKESLGEDLIDGILDAAAFAEKDPYRGATHNKGIMNGIDAVLLATGNDFRAVEAGAHAYASLKGSYTTLTRYEKNAAGDLVGTITMPLAVGTVGGATRTHPVAQIALKILDVHSASELAKIAACVGLANNFAALRALVNEGIQQGHMKLHAENIAIIAGAKGNEVREIAATMIKENKISVSYATELLKKH